MELIRQRIDRWADLSTADVRSVQSTDLVTGRAWEHTESDVTDPFRDFRPPPVPTAGRPSPRGPQLRPPTGFGSTRPVPRPPIEPEGPTIEQAVQAGFARLGLTSDQVSIEVLRKARHSFFRKILQENGSGISGSLCTTPRFPTTARTRRSSRSSCPRFLSISAEGKFTANAA
ncbi:Jag N-terminal domain-containing protein [Streptomyces lasiicapitis]|uniref:Jag N-terminal domain-containing protein n=1 Tax=Streptomyces lasiicapitis TaxID=1923961 RepID=UPI0035714373